MDLETKKSSEKSILIKCEDLFCPSVALGIKDEVSHLCVDSKAWSVLFKNTIGGL